MTGLIFIVLIALLTPGVPFARSVQPSPQTKASVEYDKFKNLTTERVTVTAREADSDGPPRIFIEVGFVYPGKKLRTRPRSFFLTMRSFNQNMRFERVNSFITLLDDKRVNLKPMRRSEVRFNSETLTTDLTYGEFVRMVGAKKVEMQVGVVEFELTGDSLGALREFADRARP